MLQAPEVYFVKPFLRNQKVARRHHQRTSPSFYWIRPLGYTGAFGCGLIAGTVGAWLIGLLRG
jgi:hypothetical protein